MLNICRFIRKNSNIEFFHLGFECFFIQIFCGTKYLPSLPVNHNTYSLSIRLKRWVLTLNNNKFTFFILKMKNKVRNNNGNLNKKNKVSNSIYFKHFCLLWQNSPFCLFVYYMNTMYISIHPLIHSHRCYLMTTPNAKTQMYLFHSCGSSQLVHLHRVIAARQLAAAPIRICSCFTEPEH